MSLYNFGKSAQNELIDGVDCDELIIKLQDIYQLEDEKLLVKIKKVIKDKKKFLLLTEELSLEQDELIDLLVKCFPEMFNHRLIKFIRKTYIFPEEEQ